MNNDGMILDEMNEEQADSLSDRVLDELRRLDQIINALNILRDGLTGEIQLHFFTDGEVLLFAPRFSRNWTVGHDQIANEAEAVPPITCKELIARLISLLERFGADEWTLKKAKFRIG